MLLPTLRCTWIFPTLLGRGGRSAFVSGLFCLLTWAGIAHADFVGHGAPVRDVVLSHDGTKALTAGFDDQVILWDVVSRQALRRLIGHEAAVNAVAFLGLQEKQAVSAGDDGKILLWDLETGELIARWEGHDKKVVAIAVSLDGKLVASGSWDRTVRLWDAETGHQLQVFEGHDSSVNALSFIPGALVSVGYGGTIRTWPLDGEGSPTRVASVGFPINDLAVDSSGARIVTGSADGIVRLWDLGNGELLRQYEGHEGAVLAVGMSPDGRTLASGGTDGLLNLWDADGDAEEPRSEIAHYRPVWSITFSPDGVSIYTGGIDSITRAWLVADGAPLLGESTAFRPIERAGIEAATSDDPVERGRYQFRKCAICHSLVDDGIARAGPSLEGLFGRRVGTYPGYLYSDALNGSTLVWNEDSVGDLFDKGPDVLLPGTKMPLQRLADPQARDDLVAFLKRHTSPQQ